VPVQPLPVRPGAAALTAHSSLKVVAVLDPAELLDVVVPDGKPRLVLTIRLPDHTVTADLNAKSVGRAVATIREQGADAIVQGRLTGNAITEAGLTVERMRPQPRTVTHP
jgi:hypothetical protein